MGQCLGVVCDVQDEAQVQGMYETVLAHFGKLGCAVC